MTRAVQIAELGDQNVFSIDGDNDRVGIGSTQPTVALDVDGVVVATAFTGDGTGLTGVAGGKFSANATGINTTTSVGIGTTNATGAADSNNTAVLNVGVVTANNFYGALTGNVTGTASLASNLTGTPDITVRNVTGVAATFTGVLTYEDVTNVDSLGIITARSHVSIADSIIHTGDTDTSIRFPAANTFTVETGGSERLRVNSSGLVGVNTDSPGRQLTVSGKDSEGVIQITNNTSGGTAGNGFELLHFTSGETQLLNRENADMRFDTNNTERLRIGSSGQIGLGGANYGTSGQVLTSKGSGAAVAWEDVSSGGIQTTKYSPTANAIIQIGLGTAQHHELTLSAGFTTITTSGGTYGESHSLVLIQPSSGIATVGFSTFFQFPSGVTPSMSEGVSRVDLVSFVVKDIAGNTGTGATELLASAGLNYS